MSRSRDASWSSSSCFASNRRWFSARSSSTLDRRNSSSPSRSLNLRTSASDFSARPACDNDSRVLSACSYTVNREAWVSSVLRPRQHSIGYTGDGFYRSKDPTNSIKVLKMLKKRKKTTKTTKYTYPQTIIYTQKDIGLHKISITSPGWYLTGGDGGHVPLTRLRRPPHWNWFSDPWVGCL